MKKIVLLVIVAVIVIMALGSCSTYNGMVGAEEGVESAWAQVENVYQRRADLIPNLVETVKGAADFEKETLTAVIEARAKATQVQATLSPEMLSDPEAFGQFQQAQGQLSGAIGRLLVAVERYPDIKANQNFLSLQTQLEGTENRITVERRKYNEVAQGFNTKIRRFPASLLAGVAGFDKKEYFTAAEGADAVPEVSF